MYSMYVEDLNDYGIFESENLRHHTGEDSFFSSLHMSTEQVFQLQKLMQKFFLMGQKSCYNWIKFSDSETRMFITFGPDVYKEDTLDNHTVYIMYIFSSESMKKKHLITTRLHILYFS